jgi:hypothetical protein
MGAKSGAGGFGGKLFAGQIGFDPITIILQIVALQFCYYSTLSFCLFFVNGLFYGSFRPHLGQIFSPSSLDLSYNYSSATLFSHILNIPFVVAALAYIVEKANKCLDFTVTIFFYHFLASWIAYKFPNQLSWWLYHGCLVTVTVLVSEYFCMKLETAEIKLSFGHIIEKGKEMGIKGA